MNIRERLELIDGRLFEKHAMIDGAFEITHDAFNRRPVIFSGYMHELTYLVDRKCNVRSGQGGVL